MASKKLSTTAKVGIAAAAVAATAAAGAAGYFFYASTDAKENRKKASEWAGNLKNDVIKQARKIKNLDRKSVGEIVDKAAVAYHKIRNVDASDIKAATAELKKHWSKIVDEASSGKRAVKKVVKKTAKKAKKAINKKTK